MRDWHNWDYPVENNPNNPFRPRKSKNYMTEIMREMEKLLKDLLNDSGVNSKMKKMKKKTTLNATVKRGNKVYRITIDEITPPKSETPDEISIEWDEDGGFGSGHNDLKE
jgi:hypothetical protein